MNVEAIVEMLEAKYGKDDTERIFEAWADDPCYETFEEYASKNYL